MLYLISVIYKLEQTSLKCGLTLNENKCKIMINKSLENEINNIEVLRQINYQIPWRIGR